MRKEEGGRGKREVIERDERMLENVEIELAGKRASKLMKKECEMKERHDIQVKRFSGQ